MDVFMYRGIILDNLNNCQMLLKPINQNIIEKDYFIQNDKSVCIGWLILDRIYPVFNETRHKNWLNSLNIELSNEIIKRRRQLIYNILLKIDILPTDIIELIIDNIEPLKCDTS
jgi:hypothetical protein